jgi:hypothetical protein
MSTTSTDRTSRIGDIAIKAPCVVASTAALTLSGNQTIDGVACVTGDRVLVKNQSNTVNNGIYVVDTGDWNRATDCDGSYDLADGTLVKVNSGTVGSGFWYAAGTNPIIVGTSAQTWGQASTVLAVVSAFMQTMLDDATAAAARATLALGTMATEAKTITTKGDLLAGGASGALTRAAIGADGQMLTANSAATEGMSWTTPATTPTGVLLDYVGGTAAPSGYVFASGRTIGNAASGATERANADTEALFTLLYNSMADAEAPVSGGRSGVAATDYAANKTITLPDLRGRTSAGKDDMGGSAANRITNAVSGFVGTTLGANGGSQSHTLAVAEIPALTVGITTAILASTGTTSIQGNSAAVTNNFNTSGGGGAHRNVQPTYVVNKIIKL